jgi:hypothetical protein
MKITMYGMPQSTKSDHVWKIRIHGKYKNIKVNVSGKLNV